MSTKLFKFFTALLLVSLVGCSSHGVNVGVGAGVNIQLYTEPTNGVPNDRN